MPQVWFAPLPTDLRVLGWVDQYKIALDHQHNQLLLLAVQLQLRQTVPLTPALKEGIEDLWRHESVTTLWCHQTWLKNPRTEWRCLPRKITYLRYIFQQAMFDCWRVSIPEWRDIFLCFLAKIRLFPFPPSTFSRWRSNVWYLQKVASLSSYISDEHNISLW